MTVARRENQADDARDQASGSIDMDDSDLESDDEIVDDDDSGNDEDLSRANDMRVASSAAGIKQTTD